LTSINTAANISLNASLHTSNLNHILGQRPALSPYRYVQFDSMEKLTSISTFHEYFDEAVSSIHIGLKLFHGDQHISLGLMNCRYGILMLCNSLESAANGLLLSVNLGDRLFEELEKVTTMAKYEIFCELNGRKLDRSDIKFARIKEIISYRNEFVHPKPRLVNYTVNNGDIDYQVKRTNNRKYPHYFLQLSPDNCLDAIEDTLAFLGWVCFDICGFAISDGALKIGFNSFGSTADIDIVGVEYSRVFDLRPLGRQ
jgi:hypothetical protein